MTHLAATTVRGTLLGVLRHSAPSVVEATVVPTVLFYSLWTSVGPAAAYTVALVWGYAAFARRLATGARVPGILVLGLIGLTVRSVLALSTGSSFLYFVQPILGTLLVGLFFLGSALIGRPFVARVAGDFYPMTAEVADRHHVRRLFHGLTILWAAVQLLNAAVGAGLLMTLPRSVFLPTKTAAAMSVTALATVATVVWSLRVARREGLVTALPA